MSHPRPECPLRLQDCQRLSVVAAQEFTW
jgi:hypothetical protein